jgi:UDP-glucose 4-epimerase
MTQVLVSGVAGFIGSHVASHCLVLGYDVVGIDDLSGGVRSNVPDGVAFHELSVLDEVGLRGIEQQHGHFDVVYHLAAYAAEGLSHFIRRFNYENNIVGSMNLVNLAVRSDSECFVFTSSIAVYGSGVVPLSESSTPQPGDPYGIAKFAVELDLAAAHHMFDLPFVIFRPHNVYGERQNIADPYRNVIGIFMRQCLQDEPLTIFGDGTQTRAFTYIDDVARIIARAPQVPAARNEVFNVGADDPYTVNELAELVQEVMQRTPGTAHLTQRNEVHDAYPDHRKVREAFGDTQTIDLRTGLTRMADWVRAQAPPTLTPFAGVELEKNLPASWAALADRARGH